MKGNKVAGYLCYGNGIAMLVVGVMNMEWIAVVGFILVAIGAFSLAE